MAGMIGKDNIALEKRKQSALMKSVKKVKKEKNVPKKEVDVGARGIIMLEHIPHGFFEKEMKKYFSQFGNVRRVRVARSKKTGKSRGYGYVEFEFREVAQIAAEAMNNYLMFERLIKCKLLPSTTNSRKVFRDKYVTAKNYPKLLARKARRAAENEMLPEEETKNILQQRLNKIKEQNKKFAEMGINYQFNFKTKDMPPEELEELNNSVSLNMDDVKEEEEDIENAIEEVKDEDSSSGEDEDFEMEEENQGSEDEEDDDDTDQMEMNEDVSESDSDDEGLGFLFADEDNDDFDIPTLSAKSPGKSQRNSLVAEDRKKTPSKSPRNSVSMEDKKKSPFMPKYSPKLLRSRKSAGPNVTAQTPAKNKTPLPKTSPKMPRGRKSEGAALTPKPMPKFSPKLLRSRKSEAPSTPNAQGKTANEAPKKTPGKNKTDLPKVSPKMLRSRKSEAPSSMASPIKPNTPAKKRAGRKSVF